MQCHKFSITLLLLFSLPVATLQAQIFQDVTDTHLPEILDGPNLDAAVGDLDNDGDLDVAIAVENQSNFLLINDGAGQFEVFSSSPFDQLDFDSEDAGLADLDGDGDLDILYVSEENGKNEMYLNMGGGVFEENNRGIPVEGKTNGMVLYDLDEDGNPDWILGNTTGGDGTGQNFIIMGDGAGMFIDETELRYPDLIDQTQDLRLGDLDGDGDIDLAVANEDDNNILLNNGEGVFEEVTGRIPIINGIEETRELDLGDVDGDGDLDIIYFNVATSGGDPQNRLLINDGSASFTDVTLEQYPPDPESSWDGRLVDINNDGALDIITCNVLVPRQPERSRPYKAFINDGAGFFEDATEEVFPASVTGVGWDVEAADFNGDGNLDLILTGKDSPIRLLFGIEGMATELSPHGLVVTKQNSFSSPAVLNTPIWFKGSSVCLGENFNCFDMAGRLQ